MYILYPPQYNNFCPCCGRPMGYNTWNPSTPYGPIHGSGVSIGSTNPLQNVEKKEKK